MENKNNESINIYGFVYKMRNDNYLNIYLCILFFILFIILVMTLIKKYN